MVNLTPFLLVLSFPASRAKTRSLPSSQLRREHAMRDPRGPVISARSINAAFFSSVPVPTRSILPAAANPPIMLAKGCSVSERPGLCGCDSQLRCCGISIRPMGVRRAPKQDAVSSRHRLKAGREVQLRTLVGVRMTNDGIGGAAGLGRERQARPRRGARPSATPRGARADATASKSGTACE